MTFEKCSFLVQTRREGKPNAVEVSGYKFACQLPDSMDWVFVGVYRRGSYNKMIKGMAAWVVTCLDTGLEICEADTRKEAVKEFMTHAIYPYERLRKSNKGKDFDAMKHGFDVVCGVAR